MTNPNSLDRWSRLARHVQVIRGGDVRTGVLTGTVGIRLTQLRFNPPNWFQGGSEGDSRLPIRLREGEGDWDQFRFFAAACEREFAGTGYYLAGCRSKSP